MVQQLVTGWHPALRLATLSIACLAATACGASVSGQGSDNAVTSTTTGASQTATTPDDTIDFSAPPPLIGKVQAASPAAASTALPFTVVAPASLGTPTVYYSNAYPEAALVYKDAALGTYWLEERASNWTTQNLQDLASCPSLNAACGDPDWTLTTLSDGTPALEIGTPPDTAVIFLHNGVRFDVLGPPSAFSEQDGLSVANKVEGAAPASS